MNPLGNEHADPSEHGEHGHHENGPLAVLFVFVGLLFGALLREINKKTRIPYTPMLLVIGIFFGYCRESLGTFGQSVAIISTMSPHMILLCFIPVLLFESGTLCPMQLSTVTGMSSVNLSLTSSYLQDQVFYGELSSLPLSSSLFLVTLKKTSPGTKP